MNRQEESTTGRKYSKENTPKLKLIVTEKIRHLSNLVNSDIPNRSRVSLTSANSKQDANVGQKASKLANRGFKRKKIDALGSYEEIKVGKRELKVEHQDLQITQQYPRDNDA